MSGTRTAPRVVLKYYLYRATSSVGFVSPIFTLFLILRDLSFTEIATLSTVFSVLVVVGEVPTGYVGDRIGRRNSLVLSMAFSALSLAGFAVVHSFLGFVVLYSLWALALTFASGSDDAWLYDTLKERLDEGEFTRVRGRGGAVNQWASALTMIAGSLLYIVQPTYPFAFAAGFNVLAVVVLFSMPKNRQYADGRSTDQLTIVDVLPAIRRRLSEPPLRSFVLYVGLLFGAIWAADEYIQPITVDVLETHLRAASVFGVSVPPEATLGFLYAGFALGSSVASYYADEIRATLGLRRVMLLLPVGTGVLLLVPAVVPVLAIPVFLAMKASNRALRPIANQYVNDHTESVERATVLSAASMVYALVRLPFYLLGGVVADAFEPVVAVAALGGAFLLASGATYLRGEPVPGGTGDAESTPVSARR